KHVDNDVHLVLVPTAGSAACKSVTAEILPHLRPDSWTLPGINHISNVFRVTGQLFFDAAHEPCRGGVAGNRQPARVANWEIHPVYAIDLCTSTSPSECSVDDESVWFPLDQAE